MLYNTINNEILYNTIKYNNTILILYTLILKYYYKIL